MNTLSLRTLLIALPVLFTVSGCTTPDSQPNQPLPDSDAVLEKLTRANDYWQEENPEPGWAFWEHAAYHTGNMEAYFVTGDQDYLDYSLRWGERNDWMGAKSDQPSEWKYSYGETGEFVLFMGTGRSAFRPISTFTKSPVTAKKLNARWK